MPVIFSSGGQSFGYLHPRHARILEKNVNNYGSRLFLESLHSQLDKNTVNDRKQFPRAYIVIKNPWEKRALSKARRNL